MTYEYACTACGHTWETDQSISEDPLKTCPSCQKETAKRLVSGGGGFILKGGGWYADLYGSAKPQKKESGESAESKPAASDTKPSVSKDSKKGEPSGSPSGASSPSGGSSPGSDGSTKAKSASPV